MNSIFGKNYFLKHSRFRWHPKKNKRVVSLLVFMP